MRALLQDEEKWRCCTLAMFHRLTALCFPPSPLVCCCSVYGQQLLDSQFSAYVRVNSRQVEWCHTLIRIRVWVWALLIIPLSALSSWRVHCNSSVKAGCKSSFVCAGSSHLLHPSLVQDGPSCTKRLFSYHRVGGAACLWLSLPM